MQAVLQHRRREKEKLLSTYESTVKTIKNYNPLSPPGGRSRAQPGQVRRVHRANPSYVVSEALKRLFRRNEGLNRWTVQHTNDSNPGQNEGDALSKTA